MSGEELLELELSRYKQANHVHVHTWHYVMLWYNANTSPPTCDQGTRTRRTHTADDLYIGNTLPVSMEAVKAGRKRRASDSSETHAGIL